MDHDRNTKSYRDKTYGKKPEQSRVQTAKQRTKQIDQQAQKWLRHKCDKADILRIEHKKRELQTKINEVARLWRLKKSSAVMNEHNISQTDPDKEK